MSFTAGSLIVSSCKHAIIRARCEKTIRPARGTGLTLYKTRITNLFGKSHLSNTVYATNPVVSRYFASPRFIIVRKALITSARIKYVLQGPEFSNDFAYGNP